MRILAIAVVAATMALSAANAAAANSAPRPGFKPGPTDPRTGQAPAAGMPGFHQPSYSIDRTEWWKPHPYFPSNGQGAAGYPSHQGPHHYHGNQGYRR